MATTPPTGDTPGGIVQPQGLIDLERQEIKNIPDRFQSLDNKLEKLEEIILGFHGEINDLDTRVKAVEAKPSGTGGTTATDDQAIKELKAAIDQKADAVDVSKSPKTLADRLAELEGKVNQLVSKLESMVPNPNPPVVVPTPEVTLPTGLFLKPEATKAVQVEKDEWWHGLDASEDPEDKAAAMAIKDVSNSLQQMKKLLTKLETEATGGLSKWIELSAAPKEGERIPLTMKSSVDGDEVACPLGARVVGVGLGPWLGPLDGGAKPATIPPDTRMSIKLLCKSENGSTEVYGNSGSTGTANRMTGSRKPDQSAPNTFVPMPVSTLFDLCCDNRPITSEKFVSDYEKKPIAGLQFYNFIPGSFVTPRGATEPPASIVSLLPTFQHSKDVRTVPSEDTKKEVYNNGFPKGSNDFFRQYGQVLKEKNTSQGIDRLFYDCRMVKYDEKGEDWTVTGVQMYLRGPDTIALNVRFQKP